MHRPGEVAKQLQVSSNTLRLWSTNFAQHLSPSAQAAKTEKGGAAQRRYTDEDIQILVRAKGLLANGNTYEEVAELLSQPPTEEELSPSSAVSLPDSQPTPQAPDLTPVVALLSQQMNALEEHIRQDREQDRVLSTEIMSLRTQFEQMNEKLDRLVSIQERSLTAQTTPSEPTPEQESAPAVPVTFWHRLKSWMEGVSS